MSQQSSYDELARGARYRLVAIGLPRPWINPLVDCVFRWVAHNGPEWTCSRLKSLKLDLIRRKADLPMLTTWVRKNSHGLPYGVFGAIMRWCTKDLTKGKSRKRFNLVLQALNIHSTFVSKTATTSQMTKFLDGVHCTKPDGLSVEFLYNYTQHIRRNYSTQVVKRGGNSYLEFRGSTEKWSPRPHGMGRVRQSDDILSEMRVFQSPTGQAFAWEFAELLLPVTKGILGPKVRLPYVYGDPPFYGGEVHFLQEPGFKMRAIASPYRCFQLMLKPFGDSIYSFLNGLPWDCTFDQSKAIPYIKAALNRAQTVHSIDLTGATDYFPLGLQLETLRSLYGDILDINLFSRVSQLTWKSEHGDISWKRGQPLGLYPSFGSFALTHGMLLSYLLGREYSGEFFVLGDDVVILDDQLRDKYIQILDTMSCPWSPSKTISSHLLAEFAGKIILADGVLPVYKWRKMSDDNFLDICRNLGPQSVCLLTKAQKRVFDTVKHLLEPIGLNISKPGSNLTSMMIETDSFLRKCEQHVMRSLVDLTRVVRKNSYGSNTPYLLDDSVIAEMEATFDEKVISVFQQTVFSRCKAMWIMAADIPQALGLLPRLPVESPPVSRLVTLKRYERLLGI